jgi:uncharacterized low-complexity protein
LCTIFWYESFQLRSGNEGESKMRKSQAAFILAMGASLLSLSPIPAVAEQHDQSFFYLAEASTPQSAFDDKNPSEQCGKGTCGSATPSDKGNKKDKSNGYKCFPGGSNCGGGQIPPLSQSSSTPSQTPQPPVANH